MFNFFFVCFLVGVLLTAISFIFGHLFEIFGVDGLDLDFDIFGIDLYLPLSPILYLMFLTIFGGMGMILMKSEYSVPMIFIILISFIIGLISAFCVYHFIIKPLKKAQNTSAADEEELIGLEATVTEIITSNSFGEITYTIHGNSYKAPAKATTEVTIKAGHKVAICWIKDHVFYVTDINI